VYKLHFYLKEVNGNRTWGGNTVTLMPQRWDGVLHVIGTADAGVS